LLPRRAVAKLRQMPSRHPVHRKFGARSGGCLPELNLPASATTPPPCVSLSTRAKARDLGFGHHAPEEQSAAGGAGHDSHRRSSPPTGGAGQRSHAAC
jgi:hypothetical protein